MSKKSANTAKSNLITVLVLVVFAVGFYYVKGKFFSAAFTRYSEFGIDIPTNFSIHGIDVSHHQQDISWEDVRKMKVKNVQIDFAFIKATEGISIVDEQYKENMEAAKEAGVIRGAYHFFIPTRSGKTQAANFLETVKLKTGDLPPVLDVEQTSSNISVKEMQLRIKDWLDIVENKYNVKPIIYSNADFYTTYLANEFDDYPLWVAHYKVKDKPRINRNWIFWQHSESAQVTGIRTNVDFNVFNGSRYSFNKLLLE
ncbi:MAG: glycoside hydrolase family 25 protein [Ferruginibacter sp.]|nr:glycoside hydrolase family 25 protein [Ferruginibacter sp.]